MVSLDYNGQFKKMEQIHKFFIQKHLNLEKEDLKTLIGKNLERACQFTFLAFGAMCANRIAMRFIAQPLEEMHRR